MLLVYSAEATQGEEKIELDTIDKRRRWEADFDKQFIRPVFDNQVRIMVMLIYIKLTDVMWV